LQYRPNPTVFLNREAVAAIEQMHKGLYVAEAAPMPTSATPLARTASVAKRVTGAIGSVGFFVKMGFVGRLLVWDPSD
jgi:hypothetical protein